MSSNKLDKLNFLTETIIVQHSRKAYSNKGIAACIKYENNFFLRHLNLKKKDVIEFGCGAFPSSLGIKKEKWPNSFVATDASPKVLKIAKSFDRRPIYKIINLEKKINLNKKFDYMIIKGVLHHTKNPTKILSQLKRYLKKDGAIIISEPNLSSILGNFLKWFFRYFFNYSMETSPYGQYSYKKISSSVKRAKLRIEKKWYSVLILLPLSGNYGRIKILPNNLILFKIFIIVEDFFYKIFNLLNLTKFLNFKLNLIIKK